MTNPVTSLISSNLGDYCPKNTFSNHPQNPLNKSKFEWIFRNRHSNRFSEAFVKINSRKYFGLPTPSGETKLSDESNKAVFKLLENSWQSLNGSGNIFTQKNFIELRM